MPPSGLAVELIEDRSHGDGADGGVVRAVRVAPGHVFDERPRDRGGDGNV